jgi:hypothetical protein
MDKRIWKIKRIASRNRYPFFCVNGHKEIVVNRDYGYFIK